MKNSLPAFIVLAIWGGSTLAALSGPLYFIQGGGALKYVAIFAIPFLFIFSFVLISGLLSRVAQKGIVKGVFPREALHPVYFLRRIYGGCWTQLFYFKPIYSVVLFLPFLKTFTLWLFGYKTARTPFVIYPDTWIRDLPMLNFGKDAYISNRATIGTNLCLSDGNIMVDSVQVGSHSLIGHLATIGPCVIGERSEVGVGATMGIRVRLGQRVQVSPRSGIGHGVRIDDNTIIGQQSHIGTKAVIGKNLNIPAGSNIPNGAVILSQEDVNRYFSSETELLFKTKEALRSLLKSDLQDVS